MENLIFSINVVSPLFLIMCLGTFLTKIKIFDEKFLKTANNFSFKVLLPCLLFTNIYNSEIGNSFNLKLVIFAISAIAIITTILIIVVPKFVKENKNRGVMIQGMIRSNFLLLGLPLCINILGEESTGVTTMLVAIVVPIFNFLCVILLDIYSKDEFNIKEIFLDIIKNPLIIGSVSAIIVSAIGIKIPEFLDKTLSDIGKIATPLALMILGGDFKVGNLYQNRKYISAVCLVKLVIIPSITLPIALAMGFRGAEIGSLFALFTSPVAVSSYTMAQQCEANYELAGHIVFVTTIVSAFTLFAFIYIFKTLGIF